MTPSLGLNVVLGIPIAIKDNANIGCRQVDSNAAGSSGQQEKEAVVFSLKPIDRFLALTTTDASIEPLVLEITEFAVFSNQINHLDHLAEDQNLVTFLAELG